MSVSSMNFQKNMDVNTMSRSKRTISPSSNIMWNRTAMWKRNIKEKWHQTI